MGCSLGGGMLVTLSSSKGMTWGLLCLLALGDGVGTFVWVGLPITLGGGTLSPIACNWSSPSTAKGALVLGPVSAVERSFAARVATSAALMCGNLDDFG
eukprot:11668114-Ditylum_brightwellii.AAC.1